jgi:hypothetical protein
VKESEKLEKLNAAFLLDHTTAAAAAVGPRRGFQANEKHCVGKEGERRTRICALLIRLSRRAKERDGAGFRWRVVCSWARVCEVEFESEVGGRESL